VANQQVSGCRVRLLRLISRSLPLALIDLQAKPLGMHGDLAVDEQERGLDPWRNRGAYLPVTHVPSPTHADGRGGRGLRMAAVLAAWRSGRPGRPVPPLRLGEFREQAHEELR
jgi:hypothetical protein